MAGTDELIYTIKFDTDDQTYSEALSKVRELEKAKSGGSDGNKNSTQTTIEFKEATEELTNENQLLIDKLIELQVQMDTYRATLKEVRDAKRQGVELSHEEREAEAQTQASLKSTSQEYRDNQKSLIANSQATDNATGSYNQLRAETKLLEAQLRAMPIDEQGEEFKSLQSQIAKNRESMKDFNADIGDHSMNVGNYAGSLSTLASGLAIVQGPLGPLAGRLNSLNTTMQASIPIIHAKAMAWGRLKTAMIGTGIGAVVVVLGTLVAALSKVQVVLDAVSVDFARMNGFLSNFLDLVGSWTGANERASVSLMEAGNVAEEVRRREIALRDARIAQIVTIEEYRTEAAELRQQAEDETNTHEERIDMIERAIQATKDEMAVRIELAKEARDIAIQDGEIATNKAEANRKIEESIAEVVRLQGQLAMGTRQLTRRRQSIINQLEVETERRRKNIEAIEDEAKARLKAHQDLLTTSTGDPLIALEEQRQKRIVEIYGMAGMERRAIEKQAMFDIKRMREEGYDEIEELEEDRAERVLALQEKYALDGMTQEEASYQAEIEVAERMLAERNAMIEGMAIKEKTIREQMNNDITDIEKAEELKRIGIKRQIQEMRTQEIVSQMALEKALIRGMHQELAQIEAEEATRRNELFISNLKAGFQEEEAFRLANEQSKMEFAEKRKETIIAIDENEMQQRLAMQQAYTDLAYGVMLSAFGDTKGVRVAQALIDTYAGANSALADPGGTLGIVQAAATIAMGLANVRQILQTDVGDTPSGSAGTASGALSSQMGFEVSDNSSEGSVARQVAEQAEGMQTEATTNIYLQGDLNTELMAIKARQGNRSINTKTLTTKSRA